MTYVSERKKQNKSITTQPSAYHFRFLNCRELSPDSPNHRWCARLLLLLFSCSRSASIELITATHYAGGWPKDIAVSFENIKNP